MLWLSENTAPEPPLALVEACHTRIVRQCDTLEKLLAYWPLHGIDMAVQQAAAQVERYFSKAAPDHHADEEKDLFPALAAYLPAQQLEMLCAQHRSLEAAWAQLQPDLIALSRGITPSDSQWLTRVADFVTQNRAHYQFEDHEIIPLARAQLSAATLAQLDASMVARRRQTPSIHQTAQ